MKRPLRQTPAAPVAAATVVVLRDSPRGPEVLMVRRHERAGDFAAASVFPGGVVDPEDVDPGLAPAEARFEPAAVLAALGESISEAETRAIYVAACRELFEEAGILVARDLTSGTLLDGLAAGLPALRAELLAGRLKLPAVLAATSSVLALDRLVPFTHWVTPEFQPRRWDARFFLVDAPSGQEASCDGMETCEAVWLPPAEVLSGYRAGNHLLAPPTFRVLEDLQSFANTAEALDAARTAGPPETILPVPLGGAPEMTLVYPGDRDYPGSSRGGLNRLILRDGRWLSQRERS